MSVKDFYNKIGGDYETVLKFMMSDDIIKKFVLKFKDEPTFMALKNSINTQNKEEIFKIAHTFKGICLNLYLGNLSKSASIFTDSLRKENRDNYSQVQIQELFDKLEKDYNEVICAINKDLEL